MGGNITTLSEVSNEQKPSYFSTEFKQEAASLVLDQGYSVPQACKSLGVGETALRRWVQQLAEERGGITSAAKAMTAEQQQIQELEAVVAGWRWRKTS